MIKHTCYENNDRPSCIDFILTNCPHSFRYSCVIETGLPDFHKMAVTVMKTNRDFKYICNNSFKGSDEVYENSGAAASCNKILDI